MKTKYDRDIYDEQTIIRAANDYSKIAKIAVKPNGRYIECSFSHCSYNEEIVIREFSNYLIDCLNQGNKYDN